MPTLVIPPGFLQAAYRMTLTGDPDEMVVTCGHDIGEGAGTATQIANHLFLAWALNMRDAIATGYTCVGVTVYIGQDGGPPIVGSSSETPIACLGGAGAVPQNTAVLIRKATSVAGREGKGRMYFPGLRETWVSDAGQLEASGLAQWQAKATDWYADLVTTGPGIVVYPPVVLHTTPQLGGTPLPTPVDAFVVQSVAASQRERLRR